MPVPFIGPSPVLSVSVCDGIRLLHCQLSTQVAFLQPALGRLPAASTPEWTTHGHSPRVAQDHLTAQ